MVGLETLFAKVAGVPECHVTIVPAGLVVLSTFDIKFTVVAGHTFAKVFPVGLGGGQLVIVTVKAPEVPP
jgi:hypothetical protein